MRLSHLCHCFSVEPTRLIVVETEREMTQARLSVEKEGQVLLAEFEELAPRESNAAWANSQDREAWTVVGYEPIVVYLPNVAGQYSRTMALAIQSAASAAQQIRLNFGKVHVPEEVYTWHIHRRIRRDRLRQC